jgi:hypothetical protein
MAARGKGTGRVLIPNRQGPLDTLRSRLAAQQHLRSNYFIVDV